MPQPIFFPSSAHEPYKSLLILSRFLHKGSVSENKRNPYHFNAFCILKKSGGKVLWSQKEAETEKRVKWKAKLWNDESSNLPASFPHPETSWVVWSPQWSTPRKTIYFCSSWEYPGCFALLCHSPPSCISCTCACLSSAKHNNGHPGGGDATFTSTKTRWAAKKGSLADFWKGFWEVTPPTSGVRTPYLWSSGLSSHPKSFEGLYDFQWVHS